MTTNIMGEMQLDTEQWELNCAVLKEVCGFRDGDEIGHQASYWYPPRDWGQDPVHKSWTPLQSLDRSREVWLYAKKLVPNCDYTFDFDTVTPTKVCEESLRVVRNARWCGTVNTLPSGDGCAKARGEA